MGNLLITFVLRLGINVAIQNFPPVDAMSQKFSQIQFIHHTINFYAIIIVYCILRGRIKGFNRSITTILCQVGSYRTVVG